MKTRMLKNRTLAERSIYRGWEEKNPCEHVRAELQRVARQVRKLPKAVVKLCGNEHCADKKCSVIDVGLNDVLALIRKATR